MELKIKKHEQVQLKQERPGQMASSNYQSSKRLGQINLLSQ